MRFYQRTMRFYQRIMRFYQRFIRFYQSFMRFYQSFVRFYQSCMREKVSKFMRFDQCMREIVLLYFGLFLIRVNSPLNTTGYQGSVQPEP